METLWKGRVAFNQPRGVCVDAAGNAVVTDCGSHRVLRVSPAGEVSVLAGSGAAGAADGAGAAASFSSPWGVCVGASGDVLVADSGNHRIRRIAPGGAVSTLAGCGRAGSQNGPHLEASFCNPCGVCVDAAGAVYVADSGNHQVRRITRGEGVATVAGSAAGFANGFSGARFCFPLGVCLDRSGSIVVADCGNDAIRRIDKFGRVSTGAGGGQQGFKDAAAREACFNSPGGVCLDATGAIVIADSGNNMVRLFTGVPSW